MAEANDSSDAAGNGIDVRDLRRDELPEAVDVIARGMRDNPLHVAAYGTDPQRRLRCHRRLVGALFDVVTTLQHRCATRDGVLVGVAALAPVGTCQPTPGQRLVLLPRLAPMGAAVVRVLAWNAHWGRRDVAEPHIHLGPVAVDAHLQGLGIGSAMMRDHCARLDREGRVGYLETDKQENVGFYERFGFEVVRREPVLGVPNWFMRRPAPE